MIGLVIAFPGMVMHYKGAGTGVDPASIQQLDIPQMEDMPPLDFGTPAAPCPASSRRAARPRPARTGAAPGPAGPGAAAGLRRRPGWSRPPARLPARRS